MVLFSAKLKYFLAISFSSSVALHHPFLRFSPPGLLASHRPISRPPNPSSQFRQDGNSLGGDRSGTDPRPRSILTGIYGDKSHEIRLNVVPLFQPRLTDILRRFSPLFLSLSSPLVPLRGELKCNFINEGECQIIARICQPAALCTPTEAFLDFPAVASRVRCILRVCGLKRDRQTLDPIRRWITSSRFEEFLLTPWLLWAPISA